MQISHCGRSGLLIALGFQLLTGAGTLAAAVAPENWPTGGFDFAGNQFLNVASRETVRNFYNAVYKASENVPGGWNGDVASCIPDNTSDLFKRAVLRRINYFRAMAGVPADVGFDESLHFKAQQAALMMSANDRLDHFPDPSWVCYTAEGAEAAAASNLSLGHAGSDAVTGQMRDDGDQNAAVGHRRWLLYPYTRFMATGDILVPNEPGKHANAIWINDSVSAQGQRPATRLAAVTWPPAQAYVPRPMIFGRWSLSIPGVDFSQAKVSMKKDGTNVPLRQETPVTNVGDNTLVWVPELTPSAAGAPDSTYTVEIKVTPNATPISYTLIDFDPQTVANDTVWPYLRGESIVPVGQPARFDLRSFFPKTGELFASVGGRIVPGATGYQWRQIALSPPRVEHGKKSKQTLIADTSKKYPYVVSYVKDSDGAAFHLTHKPVNAKTPLKPQTLTFRDAFLVGNDAAVRFDQILGWATPNEFAKVEVSLDDGASWLVADIQRGAGLVPLPSRMQRRSVSLAGLAGKVIRLRFNFDYAGPFYNKSSPGFGWYIDRITPVGLDRVVSEQIVDLPATETGVSFQPAAAAEMGIQARALAFGPNPQESFPLEWGPVTRVVATPPDGGTPRPFRFKARRNAPVSATVVSRPIKVKGINGPVLIKVTGGQYAVNGGGFRSTPGLVRKGDRVQVSVASAAAPGTASAATVDIGGVSAVFNVTTKR